MKVCIRAMQSRDIDAILNIEVQAFCPPWSRQSFEEELENQAAVYPVIDIEGIIVAYAGIWLIVDEAHMINIAVKQDYRNQGLGETLIRELIRQARQNNISSMTLEVRRSNLAAQHLYEKLGFRTAGVRYEYYSDNKEDALIMWLYNLSEFEF
jgi:ribosomal-protein-alanine N-acetyltransferase